MNTITKLASLILIPFLIVVGLFLGLSFVQAWTGPTAAPPSENTPAPLNVSNVTQTKAGGLNITQKVTSASTIATDAGTVLTTKDYVDARIADLAATLDVRISAIEAMGGGGTGGDISCNWTGWSCNTYGVFGTGGCLGYVSGSHSGSYVTTNAFCEDGKVKHLRFGHTRMD